MITYNDQIALGVSSGCDDGIALSSIYMYNDEYPCVSLHYARLSFPSNKYILSILLNLMKAAVGN